MNMPFTEQPKQDCGQLKQHSSSLTLKPIALAITASLIGLASLSACSPIADKSASSTTSNAVSNNEINTASYNIAPVLPAKRQLGHSPAKPVLAHPMSLIPKGNIKIASKTPLAGCGSRLRRGF